MSHVAVAASSAAQKHDSHNRAWQQMNQTLLFISFHHLQGMVQWGSFGPTNIHIASPKLHPQASSCPWDITPPAVLLLCPICSCLQLHRYGADHSLHMCTVHVSQADMSSWVSWMPIACSVLRVL